MMSAPTLSTGILSPGYSSSISSSIHSQVSTQSSVVTSIWALKDPVHAGADLQLPGHEALGEGHSARAKAIIWPVSMPWGQYMAQRRAAGAIGPGGPA
jgi:hypothetical protein